mmetsp:Transcript_48122/g.140237  ORF Transcript_48122/g.140237 Transcript_48122/m.140237 type:complete len:238 (-) Transcript_48122:1306-2019(-)
MAIIIPFPSSLMLENSCDSPSWRPANMPFPTFSTKPSVDDSAISAASMLPALPPDSAELPKAVAMVSTVPKSVVPVVALIAPLPPVNKASTVLPTMSEALLIWSIFKAVPEFDTMLFITTAVCCTPSSDGSCKSVAESIAPKSISAFFPSPSPALAPLNALTELKICSGSPEDKEPLKALAISAASRAAASFTNGPTMCVCALPPRASLARTMAKKEPLGKTVSVDFARDHVRRGTP